jgi:hypothetical protein
MMPLWSLGEMDLHQVAEEAGTRDVEAWQVFLGSRVSGLGFTLGLGV